MRRDQIGAGPGLERDLQQVARVEPEDRPPVGLDVADAAEPFGDAVGGREIRRVDQVVDLPRLVALLVDGRDLDLEHEAHRRAAGRRQGRGDTLLDVLPQAEQARLGRDELLLQLGRPGRMAEVAGADEADALARRPLGEVLEIEVAAGRARIFRMDVQVGVEAHDLRIRVDRL